jgi:hypothetical protein
MKIGYPTWLGADGLKAVVVSQGLTVQRNDEGDAWHVLSHDGLIVHETRIFKDDVTGDLTAFETDFPVLNGRSVSATRLFVENNVELPHTADGKPVFSVFPTEGTRVTFVTHNWCDKTTWYPKSVRHENQAATPIAAGTTYQLPHTYVVDLFHGKIFGEDSIRDSQGRAYRVAVEVDTGSGWASRTEKDPHNDVGDYFVNYASGVITFDPAIATDASVRATYYAATTSEFVIAPLPTKRLKIRSVEVQFTQDVVMNDTVDFVAYGYVDVFAPQYMTTNGGPFPPGTKIPISTTRYKTMADFQAESNGSKPIIPAVGGPSWRGIHQPIIVFPWDYAALLSIDAAVGMEVRIRLQHDVPFGGELSTATFYCLSEPG